MLLYNAVGDVGYIPKLDLTFKYEVGGETGKEPLTPGGYFVTRQSDQNEYNVLHLGKDIHAGTELEVKLNCKDWRRYKRKASLDKFQADDSIRFLLEGAAWNALVKQDMENLNADKSTLIATLYKELSPPDLTENWKESMTALLHTIHAGRMAFTAACFAYGKYHSFDWKLENWGLRDLEKTRHVSMELEGEEVTIQLDDFGISLIDHEYTQNDFRRGDDQETIRLILQYGLTSGHEMYSDGWGQIVISENSKLILNPYELPLWYVTHDWYPYKLSFKELTTYDVTNFSTPQDALLAKIKDMKAKQWLKH